MGGGGDRGGGGGGVGVGLKKRRGILKSHSMETVGYHSKLFFHLQSGLRRDPL